MLTTLAYILIAFSGPLAILLFIVYKNKVAELQRKRLEAMNAETWIDNIDVLECKEITNEFNL